MASVLDTFDPLNVFLAQNYLVKKDIEAGSTGSSAISLIIWTTAFSQLLLRPTRSVKKRNLTKNCSNTLLVKPQRAFVYLNDIDCVRRNIVEMTISCLCNALCDDCTTFAWHPCDRSAKNQKIDKKRKICFF
jgi:hypothetical protein